MPVVAATRLEGDVGDELCLCRIGQRVQVGLAREVLRVGVVGVAQAEDAAVGLGVFEIQRVVGVHLQHHAEGGPGVGPAGVEGHVREDGGHLASRNAVLLGVGHVVLEGRVGHSLGDERGHGEDGAHLQGKVVAAPHLAEQHIVVQGGELGREGAERVAAGGLDYFGHEVPRFFWGVSDATAHCAPSSFAHLISRYPKPSSKLKVKAQLRERRSFCRSLNPPVFA